MGYGGIRVPSWCSFGAAVAAVALVCIISVKLGEEGWMGHTAATYEPERLSASLHLKPWERNTALEYALKLSGTTPRSQPPHLRYYEFEVTTRLTKIGGVHRELLVINGQYPGPLVEAVQGDTVVVNVLNNIENADVESQRVTSLHFHGQLMNGTNFYDGSVGMTQCGIPPGKNFTYSFEADNAGTYWYHSHWDLQQVEGLVGPMVIHERVTKNDWFGNGLVDGETADHDEAYESPTRVADAAAPAPDGSADIMDAQVEKGAAEDEDKDEDKDEEEGKDDDEDEDEEKDEGDDEDDDEDDDERDAAADDDDNYISDEAYEEVVLLLSDLYNRPAGDLLLDYMEPWIGGVEEPVPDIALAQGKIQPVINLLNGRKVRVRIINAGSYTAFNVKLEGAPMRVIEADSTRVKPTVAHSLLIYPAQRYSVLIDLGDEASAWLHTTPQSSFYGQDAELSASLMRGPSSALKTLLLASNYTVKASALSSGLQVNEEELIEPYFEPVDNDLRAEPPHADLESIVDITMTRLASGEVAGALNSQIHQQMPDGNMLSTLLDITHMQKRHGPHMNAEAQPKMLLQFDEIKSVDLVIRNFDDGPHPVHLHGHRFWVMSRGYIDSMKPTWVSPAPLQRDTVWLPEDQWVRVRLVVDNPGLWAIHCHIPWHSRIGMKGAILALPSKLAKQKPPADWYELCQS